MNLLICHMISFAAGLFLDLLLGDPHNMFHPVRLIGGLTAWLDDRLLGENPSKKGKGEQLFLGAVIAVIVPAATVTAVTFILYFAFRISWPAGIAAESLLTYYCIALKALRDESDLVYKKLGSGGLYEARKALSMIVGRDTGELDEEHVIRAAVETVAENTSDGVIAPLLYLALAGPVGGFFYKAVNTMDSMIGYKNERYLYFGRVAAKLDDVLNFVPSRLTGVLICIWAFVFRDFDGRRAVHIFLRDRYRHKSPNSAQSEAAMAGALGVELLGGASYFGTWVDKPTVGNAVRNIVPEDIRRSHLLMYASALSFAAVCMAAMSGLAAML